MNLSFLARYSCIIFAISIFSELKIFLLIVWYFGHEVRIGSIISTCYTGSRVLPPLAASSLYGDPFLWLGCVH